MSAEVAEDAAARIADAGERVTRFLAEPANAEAFRQTVRREVESVLGRTLLERSARSGEPIPARRRRAEFLQFDELVDD